MQSLSYLDILQTYFTFRERIRHASTHDHFWGSSEMLIWTLSMESMRQSVSRVGALRKIYARNQHALLLQTSAESRCLWFDMMSRTCCAVLLLVDSLGGPCELAACRIHRIMPKRRLKLGSLPCLLLRPHGFHAGSRGAALPLEQLK